MKKFSKILVGLLVVVCIVEGFFLYRAYAIPSTTLQTARKINRIEQIIDKYYKGSVKKSELEEWMTQNRRKSMAELKSEAAAYCFTH